MSLGRSTSASVARDGRAGDFHRRELVARGTVFNSADKTGSAFISKHVITARDFRRNYGECRRLALQRPVIITNHGRSDLVVLSAEAFDRLNAPSVVRAEALSDEEVGAFTDAFTGHGGSDGVDGPTARAMLGFEASDGDGEAA